MKAIEKKHLENLMVKLDKEIEKAEKETDDLCNKVQESNYDRETFNRYQQSYHYLNGAMMMRTIITNDLRKLGIKEV